MVDNVKPTPRYRRVLRITWTVACVFVAVALVAFWVRSYSYGDLVMRTQRSNTMGCYSSWGNLAFVYLEDTYDDPPGTWLRSSSPVTADSQPFPPTWLFRWSANDFVIPYWFPTLTATFLAAFAAKPWLACAFSLRTLLIATTLLSVLLGLAVWLTR